MTGNNLYSELLRFGNIDIPELTVIGWINICQKSVSTDLPVVATLPAQPVTAGQVVTINNGVLNLISAKDGDNDYPLTAIEVLQNGLKFNQSGTSVSVIYNTMAPDYINLADELTVHPLIQPYILYYLISMYYDMEGEGDSEESGLAERFYQRWLYYRNMAIVTITGSDSAIAENMATRTPVETTDVLPRSRRRGATSYYE